jgi:TRAP-type mannitol/chloroaromatic compound transport system permease small subunit
MSTISALPQWMIVAVPLVVVWDLVWRGMGLWRSARRNEVVWFLFLLLLNTVGILPIAYLLLTSGKARADSPATG